MPPQEFIDTLVPGGKVGIGLVNLGPSIDQELSHLDLVGNIASVDR